VIKLLIEMMALFGADAGVSWMEPGACVKAFLPLLHSGRDSRTDSEGDPLLPRVLRHVWPHLAEGK